MYDRKTWAVLVICGGLLAANLYYSAQNQRVQAAEKNSASWPCSRPMPPSRRNPPSPARPNSPSRLRRRPPRRSSVVLKNDKVAFTLTNIGGGIKFAEFKNEFEVGSKTSRVRVNRFGSGAIGAIAGAGETLENIPYAYKAEESIDGKKAVYIAKLPSGLIAKKTFTLNQGRGTRRTLSARFRPPTRKHHRRRAQPQPMEHLPRRGLAALSGRVAAADRLLLARGRRHPLHRRRHLQGRLVRLRQIHRQHPGGDDRIRRRDQPVLRHRAAAEGTR